MGARRIKLRAVSQAHTPTTLPAISPKMRQKNKRGRGGGTGAVKRKKGRIISDSAKRTGGRNEGREIKTHSFANLPEGPFSARFEKGFSKKRGLEKKDEKMEAQIALSCQEGSNPSIRSRRACEYQATLVPMPRRNGAVLYPLDSENDSRTTLLKGQTAIETAAAAIRHSHVSRCSCKGLLYSLTGKAEKAGYSRSDRTQGVN